MAFEAKHIRREHAITLDLPVDAAFPLFTPIGETLWVDGWNPVFLHPRSGETCPGMVFTTGSGADFTCWSVADYDPVLYRARYARVTPASRFGWVEVDCTPDGPRRTRVQVSYSYAALSPAGNAFIEQFTADAYRAMIEEWRTLIAAYVKRAPR
jgi:hypothetical protein